MAGKTKKTSLRILLTNDDGINAPGLKSLEKIAKALSDDVWIVAPETEQSGASHSLTLADPLRLRKLNARKYAVMGSPTDCVIMAVDKVMTDRKPDLVLSGVNRGQNIADDVTYSGTIAGAMEGTALGIPSIALSQAYGFERNNRVKWATAEHHGPAVVRHLLDAGWGEGVLMNVNFPDVFHTDVTDMEITRQGKRDVNNLHVMEREDGRGNAYYWLGFQRELSNPPQGTDLRAIYDGRISVTPLHMDLTHTSARTALKKAFADKKLG